MYLILFHHICYRNFEEIDLRLLVKEKKFDKMQKVRFDTHAKLINSKTLKLNKLYLRVYE